MANTGFIPEVIPVRLTFKGKEVRFQLDPKTPFDIVIKELKLQCGFKREQQFTLKWLDIDGDPITVGAEREWQEALRLYTYNQDTELFLHIFEGPPPPPGQLCPGEDRSIYQRRGARRWKKIRRINGHAFVPKRFASAYCAICNDRIWGLGRQGYKCQACKMCVHKRCVHYIRQVCEGHPPQMKPAPAAEGELPVNHVQNAAPKLPKGKDEYSGHLPQGSNPVKESQISLDDFNIIKVIGRGSYAKVLMVELKLTKRVYAMKVIKKDLVLDEEDIDWVQTEKHVFEQASNHPFLVGLHSCFQTDSRLFFVIECVNGGDLMFHMQRHRRLPEEHARFYSSEIACALNYLHERGVIYRDLKLDNVLLDSDGHVKLTDYGMCKEGLRPGDTTSTFCGTPNYIAPEILRGQDYGISVDWWALGVLLFEMLAGRSPFDVASGHEMPDQSTEDYLFQVILEKTIRIPRSLSVKAASVLKGFLNKNPVERLGCHPQTGFSDIVSHQFYKSIDWESLKLRQITPPYKPRIQNDKDPSNFDPQFTGEPLSFTPDDTSVLNSIDQTEFEGFEYVNPLLLTPAEDV